MNLRHVGFEVNDMTKMINFYKGLGFKLFWHRREHPDGWSHDVITAKLKDDRKIICIYKKRFHI